MPKPNLPALLDVGSGRYKSMTFVSHLLHLLPGQLIITVHIQVAQLSAFSQRVKQLLAQTIWTCSGSGISYTVDDAAYEKAVHGLPTFGDLCNLCRHELLVLYSYKVPYFHHHRSCAAESA
jgi:hypothetical protein